MVARRPLVLIDGQFAQLPAADTIDAPSSEVDVLVINNGGVSAAPICSPVYISGSGAFGLARANAGATEAAIGLVKDASVAAAANGAIQTDGLFTATTGEWDAVTGGTGGLTPGSVYFLSSATAGRITTTAPSASGSYVRPLGRAISETAFEITIQPSILL